MKSSVLIFLCVILVFTSYSQEPNPDLFGTWYLHSIKATDIADEDFVADIDPAIVPTLTIFDTLEFEGDGACNGFTGNFGSADEMNLVVNDFATTDADCGIASHNAFELDYFVLLQNSEYYTISFGDDDDEINLQIMNVLGGFLNFQNLPLSIEDFSQPRVSIYPNPAQYSLAIETGTTILSKVEIFDFQGKYIETITSGFSNIDISNLPKGVYFVKIIIDKNVVIERFIKV